MRWVRSVAATGMLVAALNIMACRALAGEDLRGDDAARFLLFSTSDIWRHGGFTHAGLVWSPSGLDRAGPVLKLMFGGGVYRYTSGALGRVDVRGQQLAGAILPGWRVVQNRLFLTVFAGLDFQNHRLSPDDPSAGLRGSDIGLRGGFELWYEPTPRTMLAADAAVSTVGPSYSARIAGGWRVFDRFYLGPELGGFAADGNYRQVRTGIHMTGLRTTKFEWSAGVGWAGDSDSRDGIYGKLGLIARR